MITYPRPTQKKKKTLPHIFHMTELHYSKKNSNLRMAQNDVQGKAAFQRHLTVSHPGSHVPTPWRICREESTCYIRWIYKNGAIPAGPYRCLRPCFHFNRIYLPTSSFSPSLFFPLLIWHSCARHNEGQVSSPSLFVSGSR